MQAVDFDDLVRTGAGTTMGELLRRYWVPALLESELPAPDCPPAQVRLFGEDLVAIRDTSGAIALLQEHCAHRHASLFYGRNEEGGLRCPFHGWKYDVTGRCVDMPSEPETSRFKEHIRIVAYPGRLVGGVVFAYLGPPGEMPPPPEFEWTGLPASQRYVSKRIQESNWLQGLEGGIDSSHISFLHRYNLATDPMHQRGQGNDYIATDPHPRFEVVESPGGLYIAARRNATNEHDYWRITQFVMPWYTLIPPFGDHPLGGHAWVPIDDESCLVWNFNFHPSRALTDDEVAALDSGLGIHAPLIPGTFRTVANKSNHYLVDRQAQAERRSFSGISGFGMQDTAVQESMGAIQDRSVEHLGTSDVGIVMARRRLAAAATDLEKHGAAPPGVAPESQRVRPAALLLEKGVPFLEGVGEGIFVRDGEPVVSL